MIFCDSASAIRPLSFARCHLPALDLTLRHGFRKAANRAGRDRLFCSCFDSAQARQTVRWRRFRGLLFAPDSRAANGKAARIQAKPAPNPNPARMRPELASFDDLPCALVFMASGICLAPELRRSSRKRCFSEPVHRPAARRFCRCLRFGKRRLFRSCFDSAHARQTVRWSRFRGLEFAH